jgi:hypothetical protein
MAISPHPGGKWSYAAVLAYLRIDLRAGGAAPFVWWTGGETLVTLVLAE